MRHRILIPLAPVISGAVVAVRMLVRGRAPSARIDEPRPLAVLEPEAAELRAEPVDTDREHQEPATEAAESWLPADWGADQPAYAGVSSCAERSQPSRWLPDPSQVGGGAQAREPIAGDAQLAPGRRRSFRWIAPTRRQALGGLAIAIAVSVAAVVVPDVRNVGGGSVGVAIAKTQRHPGADAARRADVAGSRPAAVRNDG